MVLHPSIVAWGIIASEFYDIQFTILMIPIGTPAFHKTLARHAGNVSHYTLPPLTVLAIIYITTMPCVHVFPA